MKHAFSALAAAATLAMMSAPVSAQDYAAERIKRAVTQADLLAIVGSLGHQVMEQGTDANVLVVAQSEEGLNYFLIGTACDVNDVPGCQGVMMQVRFELPPSVTLDTLAKANLDQAALNTWADFEKMTLGFTRYQVLDYGVSMANIRENVLVMLSLVPEAFPIAVGDEQAPE